MRFAIIGGGGIAVQCFNRLLSQVGAECVLVLADPFRESQGQSQSLYEAGTAAEIETLSCPALEAPATLAIFQRAKVDILLSVHNHQIISKEILKLTKRGAINLHHSPLPQYRGLNSCSWAILNNESSHGVTWHQIDSGIDTGDILAQATFELDEKTTAIEVLVTVLKKALVLFDTLLPALVVGSEVAVAQKGGHSYYSAKDLPFNGSFPLHKTYKDLDCLSRAICFHPLPNDFCRPKIRYDNQLVAIDAFDMRTNTTNVKAGTIIGIEEEQLVVATADAIALVRGLTDESGGPVPLQRIKLGSVLISL